MNFKKIAITAAAGATLLAAVAPAFASFDEGGNALIIKNKAKVKNVTVTVANTGANRISADDDVKGGKIKTGDALASSDVANVVNTNSVNTCGCGNDSFTLIKNKAKVKNVTLTVANTGANSINAEDDVHGGRIRTGDALAGATVTNVVNTNTVGGSTD